MQTDKTSLFRTYRNLVTREGSLALYKGMGGPLATIPIINSIIFSTYQISRTYFDKQGKTGLEYGKNIKFNGFSGSFWGNCRLRQYLHYWTCGADKDQNADAKDQDSVQGTP